MDVIETADIGLAAYAIARGGRLRKVLARPETTKAVFRIEGPRLDDAEVDFAHYGPRDIRPEVFECHVRSLTSLWGARS